MVREVSINPLMVVKIGLWSSKAINGPAQLSLKWIQEILIVSMPFYGNAIALLQPTWEAVLELAFIAQKMVVKIGKN